MADDALPNDLEIRLATAADEPDVLRLVEELFGTFSDPPILMPVLPESWPDLREHGRTLLADPGSPHWLAHRGGRVVGLQVFLLPESSDWRLPPMVVPEGSAYLFLACTDPVARSGRVGAALTARTMAWLREAGYDHCFLHFLSASRAAGFWQGNGFRPVLHELYRTLDERSVTRRE
jgi:GNAT superfamily N-acetyltransferase